MANIITAARAVSRFERAVRAHEMRGAMPPADWAQIEREYDKARRHLLAKLTEG